MRNSEIHRVQQQQKYQEKKNISKDMENGNWHEANAKH